MSNAADDEPCIALGWTITCPDERIRSYPFRLEDVAANDCAKINRTGCAFSTNKAGKTYAPGPPEWLEPPCPGGRHRVDPVTFEG